MQSQNDSRFAFVLMPFAPEFNHVYSELIKPALEDEGFEVQRSDTTFSQQNILKTIVQNIDAADLIVAELTTSNPNVFYELGVAHGLTKSVVLLTQDLDLVPFDLKSYQVIVYSTHFNEAPELRNQLSKIARGLKDETIKFESPVTDFAPEHTSKPAKTESKSDDREVEHERQNEVEQQDLGILDFVSEVEGSLEQISSIVENFTQMVEGFGESATSLGVRAEEISQSDQPNTAAQMRSLVKDMASAIKELGESIQKDLPDFHAAWEHMEDNFAKLLSAVEITSDKDREEANELVAYLGEFQEAIHPGLDALQEARDGLAENKGLSRDLNVAIRGTTKAMDDLTGAMSKGESSIVRMKNLLEQKLEDPR